MATMTDECRCEKGGFTMIEVMVALAIVSISLGVFISILGNSMKMRWKIEDHAKNVVVARLTAEKFSLGLLEDAMDGETDDGTSWEIVPTEIKERRADKDEALFEDDDDDGSTKKIDFYNVVVGGVVISTSVKGAQR
ncbi:MAG: type II secretion system protein [Candidatus Anammoxibacter sp.]